MLEEYCKNIFFLNAGALSATQFALRLTFSLLHPNGLLAWSLCRHPPGAAQPTLNSPSRQNHFHGTETQMLSIWLNVQGYISKYITVCPGLPSLQVWQTVFVVKVQTVLILPFFIFIEHRPQRKFIFWQLWPLIVVNKASIIFMLLSMKILCVFKLSNFTYCPELSRKVCINQTVYCSCAAFPSTPLPLISSKSANSTQWNLVFQCHL